MRKKNLEDFEYIYMALKAHPSFLYGKNISQFDKLYMENVQEIVDRTSLINAMTKLAMFFEDGHTNIEIPYTHDDYCLKISCRWENERLYLTDKCGDVDIGAEIVSIENYTIKQMLAKAAEVIPHENMYLVKSRMIEYPYMNYHMFSKMNLCRIFGEKEFYSITFEINGNKMTRAFKPQKYDGYIDFKENVPAFYTIQDDSAILYVNECVCNEQYKSVLKELALQCNQKNLNELELDLSKNMGGSSAVIDEFIKYVNIDRYHRYEMIDYSNGECVNITKRSDLILNQKAEFLFPNKITCRISNTTFSSARTFAVTLKDNGIASIVGEPSGGKPSSYGMPKRYVTPNNQIRFRVSRCLFLRPNIELDNDISLFPDC